MLGRKRILYVEDDENDAYFMRRAFGSVGARHELAVVYDGTAAIDAIRTEPPDLLILDINIPGNSGFDVLRWLKAQDTSISEIPVIIFSSSPRRADVAEAGRLGVLAYCVKPVDGADLAAFVRSIDSFLDEPETKRSWFCPPGTVPPATWMQ